MRTLDRLGSHTRRQLVALALVPFLTAGLAGCGDGSGAVIAGSPQRGRMLIRNDGCGSCHVIPGVAGADGVVGPPLTQVGRRIYLAGVLRNTPAAMIGWLQNPQAVLPGNAMPNMDLDRRDARDIAAYLYTLR